MNIDHLSPSSVGQLLKCGEQWRLQRVVGARLPMGMAVVVGSAVHSAAELFLKAKRDSKRLIDLPDLQAAGKAAFKEHLADTLLIVGKDEDGETLIAEGLAKTDRLVEVFHREVAPLIDPVLIEHKVVIPTTGAIPPIHLIIDVVDKSDVVWDFKTGVRSWSQEDVDMDDQFTLGALGFKTATGREPRGIKVANILDQKTPKAKIIESQRTLEDIVPCLRKVQRAWEAIQAGIFIPAQQGWWCSTKYCGFAHDGSCKFYPQSRR